MESSRNNDDLENLFVFGYQCKIFHDDEKATYIDEGRHLIPWMGDNKLMIDRYDGRGHLYNLHEYDADRMVRSKVQMTEDEMFVEKLCDEERYLELHTDVMEKAMYEEEELKRLREALVEDSYGEVAFSYDQPIDEANVGGEAVQNQEDNQNEKVEPYYAADELRVPVGMVLPDSAKLGAILEKTAGFVARHGAQMEIVLKTKQKDNPQFNFLSYDSALNPFYRHVVQMVKMGRYQPKEAPTKMEEPKGEEENASAEPAEEVHEEVSSADLMAMIQAKLPSGQIVNTPYAALVQRLGKHTAPSEPAKEPTADNKIQDATKPDKKIVDMDRLKQDVDWSGSGSPSQLLDAVYDVHSYNASYASAAAHYGDYYGTEVQPPPPGTDVPLPYQQYYQPDATSYVPTTATYGHDAVTYGSTTTTYSRGPVTYGSEPVTYTSNPVTYDPAPLAVQFDLHQDDNVSSEMPDVHNPRIVPPPPDQQAVVDRMASYAAKNGSDFEVIVKRKQDPRFDFLYHWHVHNAYYEYKKSLCLRVLEDEARAAKVAAAAAAARALSRATASSSVSNLTSGNSSLSKSVSFSLKSKEAESSSSNSGSKSVKGSARLKGSSSDEDEEQNGDIKRTEDKRASSGQSTPVVEKSAEELERKQVTERLKDRLAAAARDRMTKEKQLQEERKRRAAAFVNMLKGSGSAAAPALVSTDSGTTESIATCHVKAEPVPVRADSRLSDSRHSVDSSSRKHRSRSPSHQSSHGSSRSRSRTPVHKRSRRSRSRDRLPDSSSRNADDRHSSRSRTGHHADVRQERRGSESDRRDANRSHRDRHHDTDKHTNGHKSSSSNSASKASSSSSSFHAPHKKKLRRSRDEEEEEEDNRCVHRKSSDLELSVTSQPTVKASSSVELEEDFSDIRWPLTSAPAVDPKLNKVKAMLKASRKEIFQEDFLPLFKD